MVSSWTMRRVRLVLELSSQILRKSHKNVLNISHHGKTSIEIFMQLPWVDYSSIQSRITQVCVEKRSFSLFASCQFFRLTAQAHQEMADSCGNDVAILPELWHGKSSSLHRERVAFCQRRKLQACLFPAFYPWIKFRGWLLNEMTPLEVSFENG